MSPDIRRTWKYDSRGNEIEHAYFVHDNLVFRTLKTYDAEGRETNRYVFSYDVNGNKTEEIDYYRDDRHLPRISKETLTYDAKNRLIAEAVYLRGSLSSKKVSTFDDKGNVIEQIKY